MKPLIVLLALTSALPAQTPPATKLVTPTKLIVSTPFDQPASPTRKGAINGWQASIGEWSVKDGALHGDELAENKHPSSCTYHFEATDMIITAQFRLGTATQIAFACRDTVPPNRVEAAGLRLPPLPHHPACGSAPGGSNQITEL